MKEIPLTRGKVALVSEEDYEWLSQWKWYAAFTSRNTKWYARRGRRASERTETETSAQIYMHIAIMKPPKGMVVDHLNHDGLDNRRENLEIVTQEENMRRVPNWRKREQKFDPLPDF